MFDNREINFYLFLVNECFTIFHDKYFQTMNVLVFILLCNLSSNRSSYSDVFFLLFHFFSLSGSQDKLWLVRGCKIFSNIL